MRMLRYDSSHGLADRSVFFTRRSHAFIHAGASRTVGHLPVSMLEQSETGRRAVEEIDHDTKLSSLSIVGSYVVEISYAQRSSYGRGPTIHETAPLRRSRAMKRKEEKIEGLDATDLGSLPSNPTTGIVPFQTFRENLSDRRVGSVTVSSRTAGGCSRVGWARMYVLSAVHVGRESTPAKRTFFRVSHVEERKEGHRENEVQGSLRESAFQIVREEPIYCT